MEYFDDYSAYIDGIGLFVIITSTVFAIYRGLVREILGIGSWILAALAVIYAIPAAYPYTKGYFDSKLAADMTTGIISALLVLIICTLITHKSTAKVRDSALNGLDRTLGAVFGLARGILICVVLYFIGLLLFSIEIKEQTKHSFLGPQLAEIENVVEDYIDSYSDKESNLDELFEKLNDSDLKTQSEDLFKKLNEPEVKPKTDDTEGYKDKERKSLDQLILETSDTSTE